MRLVSVITYCDHLMTLVSVIWWQREDFQLKRITVEQVIQGQTGNNLLVGSSGMAKRFFCSFFFSLTLLTRWWVIPARCQLCMPSSGSVRRQTALPQL